MKQTTLPTIKQSMLLVAIMLLSYVSAFAQPSILFTGITTTTPAQSNSRTATTTVGGFRQVRLQANTTHTASSIGWAFHVGSTGTPNYSPSWRPLSGGNTMSVNTFIPTTFANGAKYSGTGAGSDGLLPAITSGNYYTFT